MCEVHLQPGIFDCHIIDDGAVVHIRLVQDIRHEVELVLKKVLK